MKYFGRKKEKSLEELAKEEGLILNESIPPVGYESFEVKGSDRSLEEAKVRLLKNAKVCGAKYISSDFGEPRRSRTATNGFLYTYTVTAYRPTEPPAHAA